MKITPFFEVDGKRYEIKKTHWLLAEYKRLVEESGVSDEDKANATKAQNLIATAQKFAEQEGRLWDALCENPTEENESKYMIFKRMSDKALDDYNQFIAQNNSIETLAKKNLDILEIIAIKGISEQYFDLDEETGKKVWEKFVTERGDDNYVGEWLLEMSNSLFNEKDDNEEKDDFLSIVQMAKKEKSESYRNALKKR